MVLEHGGRRTLPGAAAFWILAALFLMLFFGSVSDYLGRLPVIIAFLAGTAVAGAGFGLGFQGAFRMITALAATGILLMRRRAVSRS